MRYASVFSGIGGLESDEYTPIYFCESDPACQSVLSAKHPEVQIIPDIRKAPATRLDVCVGGWPCQDLTAAGRQKGLAGQHSSLFFDMVKLAKSARADTLIGENVPNLMRLRGGDELRTVLQTLEEASFSNISWRVLNAREFTLPQDRSRLVIVASRDRRIALNLHRPIPRRRIRSRNVIASASGFYWTGGVQSICYSEDYVPALKVGASPPKGGTSPVAVTYGDVVRKLSPRESLALQGFSWEGFSKVANDGDIYRMAGNAVPRPMGAFAVGSATFDGGRDVRLIDSLCFSSSGCILDGKLYSVEHQTDYSSAPLAKFLDLSSSDSLSPQAAAGFLTRVIKSNRRIPIRLFDLLYKLSLIRTPLRGTKVDSFKILHQELDARKYRSAIGS
jgi:DNA (cytosine-5)-methyltransferase 1